MTKAALLVRRSGWRLDERCSCAEPVPVVAGGSGYWLPGLVCSRCRRVVGDAQLELELEGS